MVDWSLAGSATSYAHLLHLGGDHRPVLTTYQFFMLKRGFQFAPGYRLQEFLGRGQFGQVWRVTAPGGTSAAVKFIDLSDGQGQKEYNGVRRVKEIRHANLMPITAIWLLDGEGKVIEEAPDDANQTIDVGVAEAQGASGVFLRDGVEPSWLAVSMLLGGKSLQHRLRECVDEGLDGLPPKELISYMDEIAKGLDYLNAPLHDLGEGPISIQHADVKPGNIVLVGSSAVICDFGLARILARNQVTATSASGTPAYMAPEAIQGKPTRTSDQYSLAITYYHLRTATLPLSEGSLWEVLDAHRTGKLDFSGVSLEERDVLKKATEMNWEDRFESNVDMVDSLREALRNNGFTKPTFVPPSRNKGAEQAENASDDPTATLDLPLRGAQPAETAGVTLDETVGSVAQEAVETASENGTEATSRSSTPGPTTPFGWAKISRTRWAIGGATIVGGILLMTMPAMMGGKEEPKSATANAETDIETVVKAETRPPKSADPESIDAGSLFELAMQTFDESETQAAKSFGRALAIDPSIATASPLEFRGHKAREIRRLEVTGDGRTLISIGEDSSPFVWKLGERTDG